MDLRQLTYFVRVAEAGSFSAAARQLYIAQSALSQHLNHLETELQVTLLVRHPRGVSLTDEGETLFRHAIGILRSFQQARDAVGSTTCLPAGEVAVGLPVTLSPLLALPLMQTIAKHYPAIRLRLVESNTGFLLEWLQAGRLDMAVLFDNPIPQELEYLPVLSEPLYLISPPQPLLSEDGCIPLQQLAELDLLLPGRPHGLRRQVEAAAASQGIALRVRYELESLSIIKDAVRAGLGHTVASWASVHGEEANDKLRRYRIHPPDIHRQVGLLSSRTRPLGRASGAVATLLQQLMVERVQNGPWPARLLP